MTSIWILTHRRLGDLKQMQALANALPQPEVELKRLTFHLPRLAPLPWAGPRLLEPQAAASLAPPFPDVVLCAEGITSGVALSIRTRSKGATKAVCLGRPRGSIADFDLIVTTPQFRLPPSPNVLCLALPVGAGERQVPRAELDGLRAELASFPRPWLALLIGGPSPPDVLDAAALAGLLSSLETHGTAKRSTVLAVTSPRTPAGLIAPLRASKCISRLFAWSPDGAANAYPALLQLADAFIVTSDSASLLTDALDTGKPVAVHRLPRRFSMFQKTVETLHRKSGAADAGLLSRIIKWLFESGLIEARPDRARLIAGLEESGRVIPTADLVGEARFASSRRTVMDDRLSPAVDKCLAILNPAVRPVSGTRPEFRSKVS
jgi:uncharacterized protein